MRLSPKQKLFLTVFLGIMTAMAPLSTDMYLPALPELGGDFGISASLTQLTLTMTMLGMAFGQIFMGPLSDRFGRKLPLHGCECWRLPVGEHHVLSRLSLPAGLQRRERHRHCPRHRARRGRGAGAHALLRRPDARQRPRADCRAGHRRPDPALHELARHLCPLGDRRHCAVRLNGDLPRDAQEGGAPAEHRQVLREVPAAPA